MPNGGSDCCGTCWFNRKNRDGGDQTESAGREEAAYCEIRDLEVEDPFYTYCANHPHRRPNRDPIPIGPVTRFAGSAFSNEREPWMESPDTEEIRLHLLELLDGFFENVSADHYPIGAGLGEVIIRQLGDFRETRASEKLQWLGENISDYWGEIALEALAKIRGKA